MPPAHRLVLFVIRKCSNNFRKMDPRLGNFRLQSKNKVKEKNNDVRRQTGPQTSPLILEM